MTTENRTTLKGGWVTNITDGGSNTAAEVRAELDDIADSTLLKLGDSLTTATVAVDDKVVIMDTSDSDNLKTVTTQAIANLAPVPTTITIANEAIDTTCFPLFTTAATGDLGPKTNSNITLNSNTGLFGASAVTVTGSTAAGNSMYLPTTNTLGWTINGTE